MNTERKIYTIDVGSMSLKDAEKVINMHLGKKTKKPSLIVRAMELIASSGFGLQF